MLRNRGGSAGSRVTSAASVLLVTAALLAVLGLAPGLVGAARTAPPAANPDGLCQPGCSFVQWISPDWYCTDVCCDLPPFGDTSFNERLYEALCVDRDCNEWTEVRRDRSCGCLGGC